MANKHEERFYWDGGYGYWISTRTGQRATEDEAFLLDCCEHYIDVVHQYAAGDMNLARKLK